MTGFEYEEVCAEILRRSGYKKVTLTQETGDQGLDIIAEKGRARYGIQCKYYEHPVGNKAVQEAYAGCGFYDCDIAVVMTNSTFTASARELAEQLGVELWEGYEPYVPSRHQPFIRIVGETVVLLAAAFLVVSFLPGTAAASASLLNEVLPAAAFTAAAGIMAVFNFRSRIVYFLTCILTIGAGLVLASGGIRYIPLLLVMAGMCEGVTLIVSVLRRQFL